MSKFLNMLALDCTPTNIGRRARLPLTIAGLLLSAQAQAFLPTPASLVTTGELALDELDADKSQSTEPKLTAYSEPNNIIKQSSDPNKDLVSSTSNAQNTSNANTEPVSYTHLRAHET